MTIAANLRQANLLHTLRSNMSHAEFLYHEAAKAGAGRVELDRLWNDYAHPPVVKVVAK